MLLLLLLAAAAVRATTVALLQIAGDRSSTIVFPLPMDLLYKLGTAPAVSPT
jgi:hypothetical protein